MAEFFTTLIAAALGSGLTVAAFTAWRTSVEQRKSRRADYLLQQLQHLYGPLHLLCGQNEKINEFWNKLNDYYTKEYASPEKSAAMSGNEFMEQRARDVLSMMNEYSAITRKNNSAMAEVLRDNYAFIDVEDVGPIQDALLHTLRSETEFTDDRKWKLPTLAYSHIGPIHSYSPQLPNLIAQRFNKKSEQLAALRGD